MSDLTCIDESVAAGGYSSEISGSTLALQDAKAQATQITAQIIPDDATADFEVHLEAAVNAVSGMKFTKIGEWDQDSDALLSVFPISLGVIYRFYNPTGGQTCTVRLTG